MFGLNKAPERQQENQITIPVREIQSYLVDEYEKARELNLLLNAQEEKLEKCKDTELKYKAAMVTLDEFDRRIKVREADIEMLRRKLQEKENRIENISDDLNGHKIKINQLTIAREQMADQINAEAMTKMIGAISQLKGGITKKQIIELLEQNK